MSQKKCQHKEKESVKAKISMDIKNQGVTREKEKENTGRKIVPPEYHDFPRSI